MDQITGQQLAPVLAVLVDGSKTAARLYNLRCVSQVMKDALHGDANGGVIKLNIHVSDQIDLSVDHMTSVCFEIPAHGGCGPSFFFMLT